MQRSLFIIVAFALAALAVDYLLVLALGDQIAAHLSGRAIEASGGLGLFLGITTIGALAGMAATASLVDRGIGAQERGVQAVMYLLAALVGPAIVTMSPLALVMAALFAVAGYALFIAVERRVRGTGRPGATPRPVNVTCPSCGSSQVDLAPRLIVDQARDAMVCFQCDHRWTL
ncbi:MAG: hypothetical protein ACI9MR_005030 [Myxococcota bacterium]|jgi:hypothetical protein